MSLVTQPQPVPPDCGDRHPQPAWQHARKVHTRTPGASTQTHRHDHHPHCLDVSSGVAEVDEHDSPYVVARGPHRIPAARLAARSITSLANSVRGVTGACAPATSPDVRVNDSGKAQPASAGGRGHDVPDPFAPAVQFNRNTWPARRLGRATRTTLGACCRRTVPPGVPDPTRPTGRGGRHDRCPRISLAYGLQTLRSRRENRVHTTTGRRTDRLDPPDRRTPPCPILRSYRLLSVRASTRGYNAAKKVNGRNRHIAVDALGLPLAVMVTPASSHDGRLPRRVVQQGRPGRWRVSPAFW